MNMDFHVSQLTIQILSTGILGFILSFFMLMNTSACGGRENCGSRFCLIGWFMDWGPLLLLLFVGVIGVGIVYLTVDLFGTWWIM